MLDLRSDLLSEEFEEGGLIIFYRLIIFFFLSNT